MKVKGLNYPVIFFFGAKPSHPDLITETCLSNFYPCRIEFDGMSFKSSEQLFMYLKAILFNDQEIAERIVKCVTPLESKRLGRKVKMFNQDSWDKAKSSVMFLALYHKFRQNPDLKNYLLMTKDSILAEASPYDKIWGIGLGIEYPERFDYSKWRGENLLGKVLMDVRKQLTL